MSETDRNQNNKSKMCLTVDVEDWFHILETSVVPSIGHWSSLESRVARNIDKLLLLFDSFSAKGTFFWLGWLAERHKNLVLECLKAGHEIASHGYGHVLAHEVGYRGFREDTFRSKAILEDITGEPVRGFRSAGFGATKETAWVFDVIKEANYQYDASVFPAPHGHGGMPDWLIGPHFIETQNGHLLEIPSSVVVILNRRISFFGGGYLRLATKPMIRWGLKRLQAAGQPLVVYVHPREIDPDHPRLPLPAIRRFKSYVRLKSTLSKLEWLCRQHRVCSMLDTVEDYIKSFYYEAKMLPVLRLKNVHRAVKPRSAGRALMKPVDLQSCRERLLQVERSMAIFVAPDDHERVTLEESPLQVAHY